MPVSFTAQYTLCDAHFHWHCFYSDYDGSEPDMNPSDAASNGKAKTQPSQDATSPPAQAWGEVLSVARCIAAKQSLWLNF